MIMQREIKASVCVCGSVYAHACTQSLSHVQLFVTPWTAAHHAPLSIQFFRQEYWSGLSLLPLRDLPDPRTELTSLAASALAGVFFFVVVFNFFLILFYFGFFLAGVFFTTVLPGKPKAPFI